MNNTTTFKPHYEINQQNYRKLCQLTDQVFASYSKVLVLRLDLGFNKEYGQDINYCYAKGRFTQLRNNMRNNQLFNHLITYAYSLEHTPIKGWHFHTVWYFNGQLVSKDINLSHLIGQYWNNTINRHAGVYHNCNQSKENYTFKGIGQIRHDDRTTITHLKKYTLPYLCKAKTYDDVLQLEDGAGKSIRTFACGQVRAKQTNRGRPRTMVG